MLISWENLAVYLKVNKEIRYTTLYSYKRLYSGLGRYFEGLLCTESNFDNYFLYIKEKYPTSYGNHVILLRHIGDAMGLDFLKKYKIPKPRSKFKDVLTYKEIKSLADARVTTKYSIHFRYKVIILTLAATGMRVNELSALKWKDLNGRFLILRETKTEHRKVAVPDSLLNLIHKLKKYPHNYIFGSGKGRVSDTTLNLELKRRAEKIKLKKHLHNHLFRHSFITNSLKRRADLKAVMLTVGHKKVETTLGYNHIIENDLLKLAHDDPLMKKPVLLPEFGNLINEFLDTVHLSKSARRKLEETGFYKIVEKLA